MAKTAKPMLTVKPEVYFADGYLIIRQYLVCGQQPTVNVFLNNKAVPRSPKYITDVKPDGLAHMVVFKIKDVSSYLYHLLAAPTVSS